MNKRIFTERAHFMCPNMHFGIAIEIEKLFDEDRISQVIEKLKNSHPLLSSVVSYDNEGYLVYEYRDIVEVPVFFKTDCSNWLQDYEEVTAKGWDLRNDCMLRVITYPKGEKTFVVFAVHHLLCDGMALLQLATNFADIYVNSSYCPVYEDRIIESIEDFGGRLKVPFIVKYIAGSANKKWRKSGKRVSYDFYREFEKEYYTNDTIERTVSTVNNEELTVIHERCKSLGITVNDYLVAEMMVSEDTHKVIVGLNIRKYLNHYEEGSLGNYSSAYSIEVNKTGDVWKVAKSVSGVIDKIKKNPQRELLTLALYTALDQNLLDAAAISALGSFASEAGLFVGDKLLGLKKAKNYTITNLGRIESTIIKDAYFVPPCSPSAKKIRGVITINGVMKIVESSR